ncbi:MAG: B12-binding domain-containing radical SAM protein [Nanoarchaeota archaeon]|nr:B12-binding domain-containing radical SAM protein [Nanoarchaeota archaeon]
MHSQNKKKITLINTPKKVFGDTNTTELGIDNSYPIGLLLISSQLKNYSDKLGLEVRFIDANFYHKNPWNIANEVQSDYIGLNATFPNVDIAKLTAKLIKEANPNSKIILGGPAATLAPEYLLNNSSIDYIVMGEGEQTIVELINALNFSKDISTIKGIAYKSLDELIITPKRNPMNLNETPLIDILEIPEEIRKYSREIYLITSRGCSNYCNFCSTPTIWGAGIKNLRVQSNDQLFKELKNYKDNGFEFDIVHFLDDSFTENWDRINNFINRWNKSYGKKGISWRCLSRVNAINNKYKIKKMVESGCKSVSVGVESASPRILRDIGKGLKIREVDNFLDITSQYGLKTKGFIMLGFPEETEGEAISTINYMVNSKFDEIGINIVMAYPRTRLYNQVHKKGELSIPKFKSIVPKSYDKKVTRSLNKYSALPTISLSKHLDIDRLYYLKELGFRLFYEKREHIT